MSDLQPLRTDKRVERIEHDAAGVTLYWNDGRRSRHHVLWLRDNCACTKCRHPKALERTFMFIDHGRPVVSSASVLPDEDTIAVDFKTGSEAHRSIYTFGWLRAHDHQASAGSARDTTLELWDANFASTLPRFEYAQYMHSPTSLRAWIQSLQRYGIVMLVDVPQIPGTLLEVAHRIGPVRSSNFGEHYDVVSMPNPNASAYTDMGLELHTDLANWRLPPDIQMLCCLKSSVQGGESVFVDGFRIAEDLRTNHAEVFELLSSQPIEFRFHDETCDIRTSAPVIELDRDGRVMRVRFNNWLRSAKAVSEQQMGPLYAALETFWRKLRDARYRLNLRLEPGQLITYFNNRVLHGRAAFDGKSGERHLQGCYLNLEDLESKLRLLDR